MEGVPSKLWRPYLAQYLTSQGSSKCPKRLLTKILTAINHQAYSQWKHRNKYVHEDGKPFEQAALRLLDSQITEEFSDKTTPSLLQINTTSPTVFCPSSLGPPPTKKLGISMSLLPGTVSSAAKQKLMLLRLIRTQPKLPLLLPPWPTAALSSGYGLAASDNISSFVSFMPQPFWLQDTRCLRSPL
jgi:hypothetical protein